MVKKIFLIFLVVFACLVGWAGQAQAGPSDPGTGDSGSAEEKMSETLTGPRVDVRDRLAAPPLPANPTQADLGAQVYYQVCMACHGDRGQGLTDEWRAEWGEDSYCWASKCHGPKHPPQGFQFPQKSSPVIGENTLTRFDNALALYDYLVQTMPWWNPGYLKQEEYWQVTAFLMRSHNALPQGVTLDAGNAAVFNLRPTVPLGGDFRPEVLFIASILAVAAGVVLVQSRLRR